MTSHLPTPPNYGSGFNTPHDKDVHPTALRTETPIVVESDKTRYTDEYITSTFDYHGQTVTNEDGVLKVRPTKKTFEFRTARKVPKMG
jgi:myo-inositol-1-phosphate synthase